MQNRYSLAFLTVSLVSVHALAQSPTQVIFYNNGATVYTAPNAVVQVNGGLTNSGATAVLEHNGTMTIANSGTDGSVFLVNGSVMQGNGQYRVEQDWQNDATFTAGTSEVELFGNTTQSITSTNGTVTTFNDLTLTGTGAGANKVKALVNVDARTGTNGILSLNDRELATTTNTFFVDNTSVNAITNNTAAGTEGYVSSDGLTAGRLSWANLASQTYIYPTGSQTGTYRYRPVEITPSTAGIFATRLANHDASLSGYNTSLAPATACLLNNAFYHEINQTAGAGTAGIYIHYDSGTDGNWDGMAQWTTPTAATWNDVSAQNFSVAGAGSFVEKTGHADFTQDPFILSRISPPAPTLAGADELCDFSGSYVTVSPSTSGSTYTWTTSNGTIISGQGTDSVYIVWGAGGGTATVVETGAGGCSSLSGTFTVSTYPSPLAGFDTLAAGPFGNLITFSDTSYNASSWFWDFGDGSSSSTQNPTHDFKAGTYQVMLIVSSGAGCSDTILTTVVIPEGFIVPNVFSPNGDGVNDMFFIPNTGLENFSLKIFNRWGTQIWESSSAEIRWDGRTTAGVEVPPGTYYWLLEGQTIGAKTQIEPNKGFVTIVR